MTETNNTISFQATDPRGRKVVCTHECWDSHILVAHPELEGWEKKVIAAIEKPAYGIYRTAHYPNRCVYYMRPRGKNFYLKVIVTEVESGADKIVTAYPASYMKQGEVLIWPNSKS